MRKTPKRQKFLSEKCATLLLMGCKQMGSYRSEEVLPCIEEQLTGNDYDLLNSFLNWVVAKGMPFGTGNIYKVYKMFLKGKS
jgi:hypothetical protein